MGRIIVIPTRAAVATTAKDKWCTLFVVNGVVEGVAGVLMMAAPAKMYPAIKKPDGQRAVRLLGSSLVTMASYVSLRVASQSAEVRRPFALGMFAYHALVLPGALTRLVDKNAEASHYIVAAIHAGLAAAFGYYLFVRKN